jgi:hypothetical protein
MKKQIGIWIDRRQAIVVSLTDSKETIKTLVSEFEKHVPTTGGGRAPKPYGAQEIVAGDRVERRIEHHLDRYYDEVMAELAQADAIVLFGPGQAKGEMKKRLERSKVLSKKLKAVETVDKMTETQIRSKVKEFFKWSAPEEM